MTRRINSAWLRYLVNMWTILSFGLLLLDFAKPHQYETEIGPMLAIYIGMLVMYSAEKEFERWAEYHEGRHPGEVYVFCWTLLIMFLLASALFFRVDYHLPSEVVSTYIGVVSIMAFTRKSKSYFHTKHKVDTK